MPNSQPPNFKTLTTDSWTEPDPVLRHFVAVSKGDGTVKTLVGDDWAGYFLDMDQRMCPICANPGRRPNDVVAELAVAWVTAGIDAPLPGYACVVAKSHVVEPYVLAEHERAAFWEDCMIAAKALADLFQPVKMNYEIHGNTIPHLHMHLYPRYIGDPYEGQPINNQARFTRTATDIDRIIRAVKAVARRRTADT